MSKRIKVYLQYPWRVLDSPYYKYLVNNPPKNVEYVSFSDRAGLITNRKKFRMFNILKSFGRKTLNYLGFVIPNSHLTPDGNYDLIHCAHCLSKNNTPWVADIESWWQFWISGEDSSGSVNGVKRLLLNKNCKRIMPWTNVVKDDLIRKFPEIKSKVEVLYPAVTLPTFKRKKNKKPRILFATRYFWIKGGLVALETLRRIKKKYDVDIVFISDAPDSVKEKYKDIPIQNLIPHDKLIEYYKTSDIFFYPSFLDTFGLSLLEAMSYGMSILTVNTGGTKNCREIVLDRKTGIVVDFPYYKSGADIYQKSTKMGKEELTLINDLYDKLSILIENIGLRNSLSQNCIKEVSTGRFSIKKRNEKLKKIYMEAINDS